MNVLFKKKKYVYIVQKMNIKILGIGQIGGGGDTFVLKSGILRVLNWVVDGDDGVLPEPHNLHVNWVYFYFDLLHYKSMVYKY